MERGAYRPYCTKGVPGGHMFGLLNAPSPSARQALVRGREAHHAREARHICRIDGSDHAPASLLRGVGPC